MVEWKKLGDVCNYFRGRSLSKTDIGLGEANVILYGELYTTYGDYITSVKSKTSISKAVTATAIQRNDLLLPVSSTTKEAQIGKASVYLVNDDASLGGDAIILRDAPNSAYLMYYLNSSLFERDKMSCVHGTTIMHLSPKELVDKKIPIPSLSEQQRIVGILDAFTNSIENLKEQIAQRRKQYESYRDQLLDLEGKEGVEMKTLGDFGDVTKLAGFEFTEHVKYKEEGRIIALRGLNVRNGNLDLCQVKYIDGSNFEKLERSKLLTNDMLFTYVGTIGNVALIDEDNKYYLAPNVSRIRFDSKVIIPRFALYVFMSEQFHRTQINKFLNSSSMKNLSMENIRKFKLPIPPLSEQQRIVSILDTFEASINNLEQQLAQREKQYEYYRNKLLTFEKEKN